MAKRKIMLTYGEQTKTESIRVPISKSAEIRERFEGILKEYENPQRVEIDVKENAEKKSNPADIKFKTTTESSYDVDQTKRFESDESLMFPKPTLEQWDSVMPKLIDHKDLQITENPSEQIKKGASTKKVVDMDALRDIASGKNLKTSSFTTVKKPIDEIYDCIIVEKGIPVESDRIYYGTNNRIAFWDRDDSNVFYANWENKYYQFANSKEFNKFCKDNNVK